MTSNCGFMILLGITIIFLLSNSVAAKKKKKGKSKSNPNLSPYASLECDEEGISYNVSTKFEMKLAVTCVLPVMSNLKSLGSGKVMSSSNEVTPKLIKCALNEMKCVEEKTGKLNKTCVMDLKTIFVQKPKQDLYVEIQTRCLELHYDKLKPDYKSYTEYCKCIFDSKYLKKLCPNKKVKSGRLSTGNLFG